MVTNYGGIDEENVDMVKIGVVPALNLKPGILKVGKGTVKDPFMINNK